jgi:hypothetical protein
MVRETRHYFRANLPPCTSISLTIYKEVELSDLWLTMALLALLQGERRIFRPLHLTFF